MCSVENMFYIQKNDTVSVFFFENDTVSDIMSI
jgi:hypothetical protein